jgi:DNA topoisomerase-2
VRPLARHRRDAIQPTQAHLVKLKKGQVNVLRNKVRFILAVLSEELVVHNRKKAELLAQLVEDGYDAVIPESAKKPKTAAAADDDASDDEEAPKQIEEPDDLRTLAKGYDYLLSMRLWALTRERVDALRAELSEKDAELRTLQATATTDLWLTDLQALEEQLDIDDAKREAGEARRPRLGTSRHAIDATPCARRPTRRRRQRRTPTKRARRHLTASP